MYKGGSIVVDVVETPLCTVVEVPFDTFVVVVVVCQPEPCVVIEREADTVFPA